VHLRAAREVREGEGPLHGRVQRERHAIDHLVLAVVDQRGHEEEGYSPCGGMVSNKTPS
jgi:hypothetical protein